jgi:Na+/proline symporter
MRTLASGTRMFVPSLVMVLRGIFARRAGSVRFDRRQRQPYVIAIVLLTLLTCVYTAIGGIKAVIWTDVVQASLMFGTALLAIVTLLYHLAGDSFDFAKAFQVVGQSVPEMRTSEGYFILGWEQSLVTSGRLRIT